MTASVSFIKTHIKLAQQIDLGVIQTVYFLVRLNFYLQKVLRIFYNSGGRYLCIVILIFVSRNGKVYGAG